MLYTVLMGSTVHHFCTICSAVQVSLYIGHAASVPYVICAVFALLYTIAVVVALLLSRANNYVLLENQRANLIQRLQSMSAQILQHGFALRLTL